MKRIIVAYDKNRIIGSEGSLPWEGKLPADMRHFRELTLGKSVVMGRKTFESIGRPLPDRQNIVVSRLANVVLDNVITAHGLEEAYELADREICIIGGGEIYRAALPDADVIHATEIDTAMEGDTTFPELDKQWHEIDNLEYAADAKNAFDYSFVTYSRKNSEV